MSTPQERFIAQVRAVFSYLEDLGFRLDEEEIRTEATFAEVAYLGRNVALIFSLDLRAAGAVDFDVGLITNGEPDVRTQRSFFSYLLENTTFRGGLRPAAAEKPDTEDARMLSELEQYSAALRNHAPELLADSPTALSKG